MKTGKKTPLRILAGVAGALIVVGLLLLVDGITGDPISRRLADNGALAYAEKAYPGQTFTILESGGGQWFRYYARVQSEQSPDTTFTVHTSFWLFRQGEEQREVEGRNWTLVRQDKEGAAELSAALHEALPDLEFAPAFNGWLPGMDYGESQNMDVELDLCWTPDNMRDVTGYLDLFPLDAPFDKEVTAKVPDRVVIQVLWDGTPTQADYDSTLARIKAAAEAAGFQIDWYDLTLVPRGGTHEEIQETAISATTAADDIPAPTP